MSLKVSLGEATRLGGRAGNEDYAVYALPEGEPLSARGIMAVLADGMGGLSHGREAAEYAARGLLADYYATPETWSIPYSLDRVIQPINQWLVAQAARRRVEGMACALSALVLCGARAFIAHVGDTRIYRLRQGELTRLTQDHAWDAPELRHVLKRAVGLDVRLSVDYSEEALQAGDVFMLVSDGVWDPLPQAELHRLLNLYQDPKLAAEALVDAALRAGGQDNATCLVVRVLEAPAPEAREWTRAALNLPLPPVLKPGHLLDDCTVESLLHESRMTRLYKVRLASGQAAVLKTLQPLHDNDFQAKETLLTEEWLGKRVQSHYFSQVLPASSRSALYILFSWHNGATLAQLLDSGRHFSVPDAIRTGVRLLKGLSALHRLNILHRDIKPENLHLDTEGKLRILDLGVAACGNAGLENRAGTPSYMAPELFSAGEASPASDLYSVGATLYHLLTRKYPYGEIEPFQNPRFTEPTPPSRYRPDIPPWLDAVLLKACCKDPLRRYETAEEFLLALQRGEQAAPRYRRLPLAERDPLRLWQAISLALFVVNLLLIYLLLVS